MNQDLNFTHVNPAAREDILELQQRITRFLSGQEDEERFKLYRLTRGVYGQRQSGVQMFRTKIPYGKLKAEQLVRLADVSEQYTNGNLHITTRQNIQLHYVKLTDSPAIWTALAQKGVTAREACGNTVRNLTASATAGIDPEEPFDVSPYVHATFEYFLRNPICQEMGRKIKISFSSSDKDAAFTYFHDFGFIPRLRTENGREERGFKVVVGGGLGAVSMVAPTVYEFLPTDQIIPFMEAAIRVFDRYGEREKRMKARMKFLIKKLGIDGFMELVQDEWPALKSKTFPIDPATFPETVIPSVKAEPSVEPLNAKLFDQWKATNVVPQKQDGFVAVKVRVPLGNISAPTARKIAALTLKYAADDIRLSINQGFVLRFIRPEHLVHVFNALYELDLAQAGFDTILDITACPGTDTCALGVTNSTGLATRLENMIAEEYPDLIEDRFLKIKISGCMNACGQHMAANIGFHGSSIKRDNMVIPAMQIVLGGGVDPEGKGFVAEKVIKLPTKRILEAVRYLLNDYEGNGQEGEYFNDYYYRQGKRYFYQLLKPLADLDQLSETDFFDWGQDSQYEQEIGVGECAGVTLDVVGTIISEAYQKSRLAYRQLDAFEFADSIYYSYLTFVIGAKALLLSKDVKCNTHKGIITDFQTHYVESGEFDSTSDFPNLVLEMKKTEPTAEFALEYFRQSRAFIDQVIQIREQQLQQTNGAEKLVIENYYKA